MRVKQGEGVIVRVMARVIMMMTPNKLAMQSVHSTQSTHISDVT